MTPHEMNRLDALLARCAHTNSQAEADTAASMARRYMASQGISERDYYFRIRFDSADNQTERAYLLHNFRTAQRRWAEADREAAEAARATQTAQGRIWVKGHYRHNRNGIQVWVEGYYRNTRKGGAQQKPTVATEGRVWVCEYTRTRNGKRETVAGHWRHARKSHHEYL